VEQKQRFFIYGRKEMGVLILLGLMVAIFAFTLGVHLGKRVTGKVVTAPVDPSDPAAALTLGDKVPSKEEMAEQGKNVDHAADESLGQALHEEVMKTGIRLDQPRQLELPKNSRSAKVPNEPPAHEASAESGTKTAPKHETLAEAEQSAEHESATPEEAPAASGNFSVQVGSFPSQREAQHAANALNAKHVPTFIQSAELKGKGKWFRVFTGRFASRADAEKAGESFRAKRVVDSFVVAKVKD
jgi:cell division septation protein DedD